MQILIHRITQIKKEREGITIKWLLVEQVVQQVSSQLAEAIQHRCHITGISRVFNYSTKSQTISFQIYIMKNKGKIPSADQSNGTKHVLMEPYN